MKFGFDNLKQLSGCWAQGQGTCGYFEKKKKKKENKKKKKKKKKN